MSSINSKLVYDTSQSIFENVICGELDDL